MEERGVMLPVVEAHVEYLGRATYDDHLKLTGSAAMAGKARIRFDITIEHANGGAAVARGYTVHAVTDPTGKPVRAPDWLTDALA
jgi:acyl-CoA thioester hydrolase